MEFLVGNALEAKVRWVTENGRQWMVAPMVMINPGVLPGSRGALLYLPDDISAATNQWNDQPVLLNHPSHPLSGHPLSAKDDGVWERQGLGKVRNAVFDGKLRAEAWLDPKRVKRLAPDVYNALVNGEKVEISTGLFTTTRDKVGIHNGRSYIGVAVDHRPDHLAILPAGVTGACARSDGCGLLVNQRGALMNGKRRLTTNAKDAKGHGSESHHPAAVEAVKKIVSKPHSANLTPDQMEERGKDQYFNQDSLSKAFKSHKVAGKAVRAAYEDGAHLTTNDSEFYEDKRSELQAALTDRFGEPDSSSMSGPSGIWVQDMTDSSVIYQRGSRTYQLGYSEKNGECVLDDGEPEEVRKVTSYESVENLNPGHPLIADLAMPLPYPPTSPNEVETAAQRGSKRRGTVQAATEDPDDDGDYHPFAGQGDRPPVRLKTDEDGDWAPFGGDGVDEGEDGRDLTGTPGALGPEDVQERCSHCGGLVLDGHCVRCSAFMGDDGVHNADDSDDDDEDGSGSSVMESDGDSDVDDSESDTEGKCEECGGDVEDGECQGCAHNAGRAIATSDAATCNDGEDGGEEVENEQPERCPECGGRMLDGKCEKCGCVLNEDEEGGDEGGEVENEDEEVDNSSRRPHATDADQCEDECQDEPEEDRDDCEDECGVYNASSIEFVINLSDAQSVEPAWVLNALLRDELGRFTGSGSGSVAATSDVKQTTRSTASGSKMDKANRAGLMEKANAFGSSGTGMNADYHVTRVGFGEGKEKVATVLDHKNATSGKGKAEFHDAMADHHRAMAKVAAAAGDRDAAFAHKKLAQIHQEESNKAANQAGVKGKPRAAGLSKPQAMRPTKSKQDTTKNAWVEVVSKSYMEHQEAVFNEQERDEGGRFAASGAGAAKAHQANLVKSAKASGLSGKVKTANVRVGGNQAVQTILEHGNNKSLGDKAAFHGNMSKAHADSALEAQAAGNGKLAAAHMAASKMHTGFQSQARAGREPSIPRAPSPAPAESTKRSADANVASDKANDSTGMANKAGTAEAHGVAGTAHRNAAILQRVAGDAAGKAGDKAKQAAHYARADKHDKVGIAHGAEAKRMGGPKKDSYRSGGNDASVGAHGAGGLLAGLFTDNQAEDHAWNEFASDAQRRAFFGTHSKEMKASNKAHAQSMRTKGSSDAANDARVASQSAKDMSDSGNSEDAAKSHMDAARAHEQAAREGGKDAGAHLQAAASHRQAANLHQRATENAAPKGGQGFQQADDVGRAYAGGTDADDAREEIEEEGSDLEDSSLCEDSDMEEKHSLEEDMAHNRRHGLVFNAASDDDSDLEDDDGSDADDSDDDSSSSDMEDGSSDVDGSSSSDLEDADDGDSDEEQTSNSRPVVGGGGTNAAAARAHKATARAEETGDPFDHAVAAGLRSKAAGAHLKHAARLRKAGDEDGAEQHEGWAAGHQQATQNHMQARGDMRYDATMTDNIGNGCNQHTGPGCKGGGMSGATEAKSAKANKMSKKAGDTPAGHHQAGIAHAKARDSANADAGKHEALAEKLHAKGDHEGAENAETNGRNLRKVAASHDNRAQAHFGKAGTHEPAFNRRMNDQQALSLLTANCRCQEDRQAIRNMTPAFRVAMASRLASNTSGTMGDGSDSVRAGGQGDKRLAVSRDEHDLDLGDDAEDDIEDHSPAFIPRGVGKQSKKTTNELVAALPPTLRGILSDAVKNRKVEHRKLVRTLTANVADKYKTQAQRHYSGMSVEELRREIRFRPSLAVSNYRSEAVPNPVLDGGRVRGDDPVMNELGGPLEYEEMTNFVGAAGGFVGNQRGSDDWGNEYPGEGVENATGEDAVPVTEVAWNEGAHIPDRFLQKNLQTQGM